MLRLPDGNCEPALRACLQAKPAARTSTTTLEPTLSAELIAILALGVPLVGLLLTVRRHARADLQALRADNHVLRAEVRAEIQNLRVESRAENHAFRAKIQAGDQRLREDVHTEMSNLRTDVQALAERTARLEGAIQALVAVRDDRDRHAVAA